jgi:chromosome partitioning protein
MSFYAITGAIQILETVEADSASSIQLLGLVLNCFDSRTHLARMVTEAVREKWGGRVFDTVIRKNVSIEEAPSQRKTIYEHAPSSRGAEDFELLTDEFLRRLSL